MSSGQTPKHCPLLYCPDTTVQLNPCRHLQKTVYEYLSKTILIISYVDTLLLDFSCGAPARCSWRPPLPQTSWHDKFEDASIAGNRCGKIPIYNLLTTYYIKMIQKTKERNHVCKWGTSEWAAQHGGCPKLTHSLNPKQARLHLRFNLHTGTAGGSRENRCS